MRKSFAYLILVALLLCLPAEIYAYKIKDIDVELQGTMLEMYDDNITFANDDEKKDFITNITPGFTAKYEDELKSWLLTGNINQQIFAKNGNFDNTAEDFSFALKKELSKYERISLADAFSHTYEPVTFEEAFGRTLGRYSYYANDIAVEYIRDINNQLTVTTGCSNEIDLFSRQDLSDSYLNKVYLEASYSLSSAATFLLFYQFSNRQFDPGADAFVNRLASGLKQNITKQLNLDTRIGIDVVNSYSGADYIKPMVSLSLTDEIDDKTSLNLKFIKDYTTSPYIEDIFNRWEVSSFFTREAWRNSGYSASVFYGEGKYAACGITDKFMGAEVAYFYNLTSKLKLKAAYSFLNVDSTELTREYKKNKIAIGLTREF